MQNFLRCVYVHLYLLLFRRALTTALATLGAHRYRPVPFLVTHARQLLSLYVNQLRATVIEKQQQKSVLLELNFGGISHVIDE